MGSEHAVSRLKDKKHYTPGLRYRRGRKAGPAREESRERVRARKARKDPDLRPARTSSRFIMLLGDKGE